MIDRRLVMRERSVRAEMKARALRDEEPDTEWQVAVRNAVMVLAYVERIGWATAGVLWAALWNVVALCLSILCVLVVWEFIHRITAQ